MFKYYVYRHIRLDKNIPFYIGLGTKQNSYAAFEVEYNRAFSLERSDFWKRITDKTNYKVEIVFESNNYQEVKDKEIELISLYKKINDGGSLCNISIGGDGHGLNAIPVVYLDKDLKFIAEFSSIKEAELITGHSDKMIIAKAKGKRKAWNHAFVYKSEYDPNKDYSPLIRKDNNISQERKKEIVLNTKYKLKPVDMYDLNNQYIKTFNSVKEAIIFIKKVYNPKWVSFISRACRKDSYTAFGYKWKNKK